MKTDPTTAAGKRARRASAGCGRIRTVGDDRRSQKRMTHPWMKAVAANPAVNAATRTFSFSFKSAAARHRQKPAAITTTPPPRTDTRFALRITRMKDVPPTRAAPHHCIAALHPRPGIHGTPWQRSYGEGSFTGRMSTLRVTGPPASLYPFRG